MWAAATRRLGGLGVRRAGARRVGSLPDLEPPDPDRLLVAHRRDPNKLGTNWSNALRRRGRMPVCLLGDRMPFEHLWVEHDEVMKFLRRPHFQRELLTLSVEGGERVRVLPQEVQFDDREHFNVKHVNLRRWPRDPAKNPVKLKVPFWFTHEDAVPTVRHPPHRHAAPRHRSQPRPSPVPPRQVKAGGYVVDMFPRGLLTLVRDACHIPRFLHADMRKAVGDDLRSDAIDFPPGLTVRLEARTRDPKNPNKVGNFLIGRAKRIRG